MRTGGSVFIFSRAIRTGKTTELSNWCGRHHNLRGFLTPDIAGRRILLDISSGIEYLFQTDGNHEDQVSIGTFHFSATAFQIARSILQNAIGDSPSWIIVDEVGPLEINHHLGFEPALTTIIQFAKATGQKLLLTVREQLVPPFLLKYDVPDSRVVHHLSELAG